jgi:hypothetical protein
MFSRLSASSFTILVVSALQFRTAARFADTHTLSLRAADATSRPRIAVRAPQFRQQLQAQLVSRSHGIGYAIFPTIHMWMTVGEIERLERMQHIEFFGA